MDVALELVDVRKSFRQGGATLEVLKGIALRLERGEIVALLGQSGSGKSTLLHIAGLLERPDGGQVRIGGVETGGLGDGARTRLRREALGFIYQFHHLLPEFSAIENAMMPLLVAGGSRAGARARAEPLLAQLGLAARATHRPARLSGGEQQRVAIARAVANAPRVLLADEPTGNLDPGTADHVFNALMQLVKATRVAMLIATHNLDLAARMDRRVSLANGQIVELE
jgi:lipoprotein-releasing system ATP-binding protein